MHLGNKNRQGEGIRNTVREWKKRKKMGRKGKSKETEKKKATYIMGWQRTKRR